MILIFEVTHAVGLCVAAHVSASFSKSFCCGFNSCFSKFKELALAYVKNWKQAF